MNKSEPVIWDPLLRIFHWSLALFFALAYWLEGDWLSLHSHAGYTVALLLLFRIVWGVIGATHARFSGFVLLPGKVLAFVKQLASGNAERHIGHNPAGTVMICALLLSLLVTAFTGMSLYAMEGSGPFANTFVSSWPGQVLENVHGFFADFTLVLVTIHIGGVLITSLAYKENLTLAMITGAKKPVANIQGQGEGSIDGSEN